MDRCCRNIIASKRHLAQASHWWWQGTQTCFCLQLHQLGLVENAGIPHWWAPKGSGRTRLHRAQPEIVPHVKRREEKLDGHAGDGPMGHWSGVLPEALSGPMGHLDWWCNYHFLLYYLRAPKGNILHHSTGLKNILTRKLLLKDLFTITTL